MDVNLDDDVVYPIPSLLILATNCAGLWSIVNLLPIPNICLCIRVYIPALVSCTEHVIRQTSKVAKLPATFSVPAVMAYHSAKIDPRRDLLAAFPLFHGRRE